MISSRSINHATYVPIGEIPDAEATDPQQSLTIFQLIKAVSPSSTELAETAEILSAGGAGFEPVAETTAAIQVCLDPQRPWSEQYAGSAAADPATLREILDLTLARRGDRIAEAAALVEEVRLQLAELDTVPDEPGEIEGTPDAPQDPPVVFEPGISPGPVIADPVVIGPVLSDPVLTVDPAFISEADLRTAVELDIAAVSGLSLLASAAGLGGAAQAGTQTVADLVARAADVPGANLSPVLTLLEDLKVDPGSVAAERFETTISVTVDRQKLRLQAFLTGLSVPPIGYLHLERIEFNPMGTETGELVYTAPLAPEESLNFTHTEWSLVQEELESYVKDELDDFVERGVTEKNDLSQSFTNEVKVDHQFKANAKVGGKYGDAFQFSTSASYDFKKATSESVKETAKTARELTHKASTRAKQEHKQSFKLSAQTREEDVVQRTIRNPHPDKAMRVDYYRMMRRWRVDLLRYGVRLTWDMNVPEPGVDLLKKINKINQLEKLLAIPFEAFFQFPFWRVQDVYGTDLSNRPAVTASSTRFEIVRDAARRHGATIKVPRNAKISYGGSQLKQFQGQEQIDKDEFFEIKYKFPDYHLPSAPHDSSVYKLATPDDAKCLLDTIEYAAFSDEVTIVFHKYKAQSVRITHNGWAHLNRDVIIAWENETYEAIREAAQEQFDRVQGLLMEERDRLLEDLSVEDTLSLRRLEREELVKNVLRWIFGPGFHYLLPSLSRTSRPGELGTNTDSFFDGATKGVLNDTIHEMAMAHGDLIKFLHQAIEWENMQYVLYPYFWVTPAEWQAKLDLRHPDPIHQAFLKAGSARVVVPIRPGFEDQFTMFLARGRLEVPDDVKDLPYVRIAQEMQYAAQTNYPGIRAANPEDSARPLLTYRQQKAWDDIQEILKLIETYHKQHQTYPATLADLNGLIPAGATPVQDRKDPWQNGYVYRFPGDNAEFDLASWGANGKPGVTDVPEGQVPDREEADITSWADASLVAQWFEYTPTSALDIDVKYIPITT